MSREQHKSAGILPFARFEGGVHVLLPFEENAGTRRCKYYNTLEGCRREGLDCDYIHVAEEALRPEEYEMKRLNLLGGRREEGENVLQTATREFSEETGGLIRPGDALNMIMARTTDGPHAISGGYRLYLCCLERHFWDVDVRYFDMVKRPKTAEADYLLWVPISELLPLPLKRDDYVGPYVSVRGIQYPISHLVVTLLQRHRNAIEQFANRLLASQ